jgi:hypothetical protein
MELRYLDKFKFSTLPGSGFPNAWARPVRATPALPFVVAIDSFHCHRQLIGPFVNVRLVKKTAAWSLFGSITVANLTLMWFWVRWSAELWLTP